MFFFRNKPFKSTDFDAEKNQPKTGSCQRISKHQTKHRQLNDLSNVYDNTLRNSSLLNIAVNSVLNRRLRFLINLMQIETVFSDEHAYPEGKCALFPLFIFCSFAFLRQRFDPRWKYLVANIILKKESPRGFCDFCSSVADSFRRGSQYVNQ